MLRECVRLAREENRLVVFLEPIALYPMRDLHAEKDGAWMDVYPQANERLGFGDIGVTGEGTDLAILTYGNGVYLSHQARKTLAEDGLAVRIIDLRWLAPLPEAAILDAISGVKSVLVVDECRRSGNIGEALMTLLAENGITRSARVAAEDSFIATGPAYAATLPCAPGIAQAARTLAGRAS
ncbi:MAG: hypothetical protein KDI98_09760 [Hyphomicrobiaceae bacterium]|nr:hypothetical protein [Hyphomicrobiaceae bacterium]